MTRLWAAAMVMMMSASSMAGMGISHDRWSQFRSEASFVGVFRDYRGARAAFFVEDDSGLLIGPLDLDAPSGPGWALTPGPEPKDLKPGDHVEVVWAAVVRAERPFGHPPAGDLAKTRQDRKKAQGPLDGMLVSVEKRGTARPIVTSDALGLALLGRPQTPVSDEDRHQAAVGQLLRRDAAQFRASRPNSELSNLGALIFDGLRGIQGPLAPVARLWLDGKKAEARAELLRKKTDLRFYFGHDRWKRPPHPMEHAPGAPIQGPFLRWREYNGADALAIHYVAPEFVKFLVAELHWSDPPF